MLPLDRLRVSRSLRRSLRRYELRVDTAFRDVVVACADPNRAGRWINQAIIDAYTRLHQLGWTHSVEAWSPDGRLVGGLYGVAVQGLFAGESMFSWSTDASKVALVGLVQHLRDSGMELLDVQWQTDHLATLGVVEVARPKYLELLGQAVASGAAWTPVRQITVHPRSGRPQSGRTGLAGSEPGLGD